jgi:hypothetical protein
MRHKRLLALLAPTLAVLAAVPAAAQTQEPAKAPKPALRALSMKPLTIAGLRFKAHERVNVIAIAGRQESVQVVATGDGTFTARFDISIGRCGRFAIHAFGSRGSRGRLVPRGNWLDCVPDDGEPPPNDLPTLKRPRSP